MKAICINSRIHITKSGLVNDAKEFLVEGRTYNILDTVVNKLNEVGYILKEIKSPSQRGSFSSERFIPCSEQNEETILIKQINQEL